MSDTEERSYLKSTGWTLLRKEHSPGREYWVHPKMPICSFDRRGAVMTQRYDEAEAKLERDKELHLRNTGWMQHENRNYPDSEYWTHKSHPDKKFVRNAAVMQQTWDENYCEN